MGRMGCCGSNVRWRGKKKNIKQIEIVTVDQSMLQAVWHESRISRSLVQISVLKLSNIIVACAAVSSCRICRHSFIFIVPQLIYVPHYSKKV